MTNDAPVSAPTPSGVLGEGPLGREIQLTRRFRAPIDAVWAAMTESERMQRWIGRWEGDPRTGRVDFFMTAEGEDVPASEYRIEVCDPPHRLVGSTSVGEEQWRLRFELDESDGVTTVVFAQAIVDDVGSVGPGWEYYLDRLDAALADGDVAAVSWDAYYPTMRPYYEGLTG